MKHTQGLLENGNLALPLFHGTSSIFIESIRQHGLGGVNPIQQYDVVPFMQRLFERCQRRLAGSREWEIKANIIGAIAQQEVKGFNFRHGATYLTPARYVAARYACSNRLGSEAISEAAECLLLLPDEDRTELRRHPVAQLFDARHEPIVIRVESVPVSYLRTEYGGDPREQLDEMVELARLAPQLSDLHRSEVLWQQENFELIEPIEQAKLVLFRAREICRHPPNYRFEVLGDYAAEGDA